MKCIDKQICIPTYSGVVKIGSKNTEKINILTKILLQGIKLGLSVEKIRNIIKLPINLLEEDLDRLEKVKIIYRENETLKLTEIGEKNYKIIRLIEEFNKNKVEIVLDRYTGLIFLRKDLRLYFDDLDEKYQKYKESKEIHKLETGKFIEHLYYNKDPRNSRRIIVPLLKEKCKELEIELTSDLLEDIYVEVDLENKRKGYVLSNVKSSIKNVCNSELRRDVSVRRLYYNGNLKVEFKPLKNIKPEVLNSLKMINLEDEGLLSKKAIELIEKMELSKKKFNSYYDPIRGHKIDKLPEECVKDNEKKIYNYPFNFDKSKILFENDEVKEIKLKYEKEVKIIREIEEYNLVERYPIEELLEFYEEVLKNGLHKFEETI